MAQVRDCFTPYMSDARWQIYSNDLSPDLQNVRESQFALGNGYVGSRGVLEEMPRGAWPGTYLAGVFDSVASQVPEMVNAPNPFDLRISVAGEKLDVAAMEVLDHRQVLDMRRALLTRRTIYANAARQRFAYQSLRFISLPNPHLLVMRAAVTPFDGPAAFSVLSAINTAVVNKGIVTEGDKRHFNIHEVTKQEDINFLTVETFEKRYLIAYASLLEVTHGNRTYYEPHRIFEVQARPGETVFLTKYVVLATSREFAPERLKETVAAKAAGAARDGFDVLVQEHSRAWAIRWKRAEISIAGDPDAERFLRFNIFQMMIMVNEGDSDISLGARGLTGEGYRGHSFWDTEIFMFPFYVFEFPRMARNLLLYRYQRLPEARKNARERGFEGAMFPWESADKGNEVTPAWHKDLDGSIKKITTGSYEHHITADVAYAVFQYYTITQDEDFMLKYGLELFVETARFWLSRVELNEARKYYEIKGVTGPDEFHENVNNNAFTNAMARWNLGMAARLVRQFHAHKPDAVKALSQRLLLRTGEAEGWARVAGKIYVPRKGELIEAFSGYFKRKHLPLPEVDDYFIPVLPKMPARRLEQTQYVKQADTVMLVYLLADEFTNGEAGHNYKFYDARTLHKSSLSPAVHSAVAARAGDMVKARRYLMASLVTDLRNVHGNTQEGVHTACLGGSWQAVVMGFAGLRVSQGVLAFDPKLPAGWKAVSFSVCWRGDTLWVNVSHERIQLRWERKKRGAALSVRIGGVLHELKPNRVQEIISVKNAKTRARVRS